jgi:hypothetical protein
MDRVPPAGDVTFETDSLGGASSYHEALRGAARARSRAVERAASAGADLPRTRWLGAMKLSEVSMSRVRIVAIGGSLAAASRTPPYLTDRVVGLINTAGGTHGLRAVNTMEFAVPCVTRLGRASRPAHSARLMCSAKDTYLTHASNISFGPWGTSSRGQRNCLARRSCRPRRSRRLKGTLNQYAKPRRHGVD